MIKVGLTGGIGSGKSVVARIFEVIGIPVYYADAENKQLMNTDPVLKKNIIEQFGEDSYTANELNRQYIADIVFNDPQKLKLLNALTHPVVIRHAADWMNRQTTAYVIKEAALIFESNSDKDLDYVVGVFSPEALRIRRVMIRDNIDKEEVLKRIRNQMDEKEKMERCDFIIHNNEQELLIPQVIELHKKMIELSTAGSPVS